MHSEPLNKSIHKPTLILYRRLIDSLLKGSERTVLLKKNIVLSVMLKGINIIIVLLMVPMVIGYVNTTQYGIWLTLSSIIGWFYMCDMGLGMGLRNRFAESKARGDTLMARRYVSTTYAAVTVAVAVLLAILLPLNYFIDWTSVLNLPGEYRLILSHTFIIMIICFGINMVAQTFNYMTSGDQRPAISMLISVADQAIVLIGIYLLTRITPAGEGSLPHLAVLSCAIPPCILIMVSAILYRGRYRWASPSLSLARLSLVKDILGMGAKFFAITLSTIMVFQLTNVIISRELGPESVTEYNIAFKYFNVLWLVFGIVLNPFWSAFTDAYTLGNYGWMRSTLRALERCALCMIPVTGVMLMLAPMAYRLWIGDSVTVSTSSNIAVAGYVSLLTIANVYLFPLNGIGKVTLQMCIYITSALVAFPVMSWMCRHYGIPGLLAFPSAVYLILAFTGALQSRRIINRSASGIWNR